MHEPYANCIIRQLRDRHVVRAAKEKRQAFLPNSTQSEPSPSNVPDTVTPQADEERILTIDELSSLFNVSKKTISRWRKRGLLSGRFVSDGRNRIGFLQSSVEHFVRQHEEQVRRSAQFSQLTEEERRGIISGAQHLRQEGRRSAEMIRHLAHETGRSTETIRYTLKQHDRRHPDMAVLAGNRSPIANDIKREIDQRRRRGEAVSSLAKRYGCSEGRVRRILAEMRFQQIQDLPLDFIPNKHFSRTGRRQEKAILGPWPPSEGTARKARRPSGLPPYLASLYEIPLLTREQEVHLFRKMNYLKYRAAKLREQIDPARPNAALMNQVERLYEESVATKNQIVRANLRLVVSLAKRHAGPSQGLFELISDGNISLMRAAEKFDFSRGFKFSTYATWAIIKNFARTIPAENQYHSRYRTSRDEMFVTTPEERGDQRVVEMAQSLREHQVTKILKHLDERESQIIRYRFGLNHGHEPMTLKEVGAVMGVTKERIRQLETRAIAKLRQAVEEERIEAPETN